MSVLETMEDATRLVPTQSGATSVIARVAICSTKMGEAAMVSTSTVACRIDSTKKSFAIIL